MQRNNKNLKSIAHDFCHAKRLKFFQPFNKGLRKVHHLGWEVEANAKHVPIFFFCFLLWDSEAEGIGLAGMTLHGMTGVSYGISVRGHEAT